MAALTDLTLAELSAAMAKKAGERRSTWPTRI